MQDGLGACVEFDGEFSVCVGRGAERGVLNDDGGSVDGFTLLCLHGPLNCSSLGEGGSGEKEGFDEK